MPGQGALMMSNSDRTVIATAAGAIPSEARDLAVKVVALGFSVGIAMPAFGQAPVLTDQSMKSSTRFQAVSALSNDVAWISGTRGSWARTLDGGKTWQAGMVPGADSLEFRDVQ